MSVAPKHNVITVTTARKSDRNINCSIRLLNEGFKDRSYCTNTMSELKAVLRMTTVRHDTSWKTATPLTHSCSNDNVTQLGPLEFWFWCDVWSRRDQWCVFCTPSLAVCSTRCSQPDLNLANLEATVATNWTLAFPFQRTPRQYFDDVKLTSSLGSVVQVVMILFIIFQLPWNQDELCQKLRKFVKLWQSYA